MKLYRYFLPILLSAVCTAFVSCSKDDDKKKEDEPASQKTIVGVWQGDLTTKAFDFIKFDQGATMNTYESNTNGTDVIVYRTLGYYTLDKANSLMILHFDFYNPNERVEIYKIHIFENNELSYSKIADISNLYKNNTYDLATDQKIIKDYAQKFIHVDRDDLEKYLRSSDRDLKRFLDLATKVLDD